MTVVVVISIVLGLLWNVIAVYLMGGRLNDAIMTSFAPAGAIAEVVAGLFTIWSRERRGGQERVVDIATYYGRDLRVLAEFRADRTSMDVHERRTVGEAGS